MKPFVNQERCAAWTRALFAGDRSEPVLLGVFTLGVAATAGPAFAAIWLGLAVFALEAHRLLAVQTEESASESLAALELTPHDALQIARASAIGAAIAMVWFSRAPYCDAIAALMLCLFALNVSNAQLERRVRFIRIAPAGMLVGLFMLDGIVSGAGWAAAALGVCAGFGLWHISYRGLLAEGAKRESEAQRVARLAQINVCMEPEDGCSWEIDFQSKQLRGGERLSRLLGRAVSYKDVVDGVLFAPEHDAELVRDAFSKLEGPARRIALVHDVSNSHGGTIRVRHEGVVEHDFQGLPRRFICLTQKMAEVRSEHLAPPSSRPTAGLVAGLVAEEGPERHIVVQTLSKIGIAAVAAKGDAPGLEDLRAQEPVLLLADVRQEATSAWDVLNAVRRDGLLKTTPVIAIVDPISRDKAVAFGAAAVIEAPIEPSILAATALRLARQRSPQQGSPQQTGFSSDEAQIKHRRAG